jgi:hypothetical protein
MDKFNLNIDNYNISELKNLLNLQTTSTIEQINFSVENLKERLIKENSLDPESKQKITFFLDNTSNRLRNSITDTTSLLDQNYQSNFQKKYKNNIEQYGNNILIKENELNDTLIDTVSVKAIPRGILNPIKIKRITKKLNIDSKFRPDYFTTLSTDYTITLPERINKIATMKIVSAEIPISFYAISPKLNNTTFTITLKDDQTPKIIHLPEGNYECQFTDKIKAAFIENAVNDALLKKDISNIVYTVDIVSGKSIFATKEGTRDPNQSFTIDFNVDNEGNVDNNIPIMFRLGWLLGFRAARYKGETAISESICMISRSPYLYIGINDYQNNSNNHFTAAFSESILSPNIMERVSTANLLSSSNRIYCLSNLKASENAKREYFGPVDIQRLSISLYDEYGRIVDLNGMDWSLLLEFECIYD